MDLIFCPASDSTHGVIKDVLTARALAVFGKQQQDLQSINCMCVKLMKLFAYKIMLWFNYYAIVSVDFATSEAEAS